MAGSFRLMRPLAIQTTQTDIEMSHTDMDRQVSVDHAIIGAVDLPRRKSYHVTDALRSFIVEAMDKRQWNARDVAARSDGAVSYRTVYTLVRGQRQTIHYTSIAGIARSFGLAPKQLVSLVSDGEPWRMPEEFDVIPPEIRRDTERYLQLLWRTGGLLPKR